MTPGTAHEVHVEHSRLKPGWYVGVCSCGGYKTRVVAYPGDAERRTREHAVAKGARP